MRQLAALILMPVLEITSVSRPQEIQLSAMVDGIPNPSTSIVKPAIAEKITAPCSTGRLWCKRQV
ncbi:hypothetical protein AQB9606_03218 [Aquabacterium sp. CECT 9606]|nr:hypothetical protein AQB9606_03218 [Aquabacterium sp. CECT 9606]